MRFAAMITNGMLTLAINNVNTVNIITYEH